MSTTGERWRSPWFGLGGREVSIHRSIGGALPIKCAQVGKFMTLQMGSELLIK